MAISQRARRRPARAYARLSLVCSRLVMQSWLAWLRLHGLPPSGPGPHSLSGAVPLPMLLMTALGPGARRIVKDFRQQSLHEGLGAGPPGFSSAAGTSIANITTGIIPVPSSH